MRKKSSKLDSNRYPKGWNRARVEGVIQFYDRQTEDDAIAEADAAWENSRVALMRVPTELVDTVNALIAKSRNASERKSRRKSA